MNTRIADHVDVRYNYGSAKLSIDTVTARLDTFIMEVGKNTIHSIKYGDYGWTVLSVADATAVRDKLTVMLGELAEAEKHKQSFLAEAPIGSTVTKADDNWLSANNAHLYVKVGEDSWSHVSLATGKPGRRAKSEDLQHVVDIGDWVLNKEEK